MIQTTPPVYNLQIQPLATITHISTATWFQFMGALGGIAAAFFGPLLDCPDCNITHQVQASQKDRILDNLPSEYEKLLASKVAMFTDNEALCDKNNRLLEAIARLRTNTSLLRSQRKRWEHRWADEARQSDSTTAIL
ncbi:hypothetical protein SERLADRAFT_405170 [Serpula lacrymans var. lacrymans S7.9]|uniref:Uncharacterized protein n=1 Tax=Serpula lacrymans var. lacrymans (strain S7.9) TaxID=578457 RepID=F8NIX0_SERL9|nr:uncharacterized protein SERLADRAFT_405170 [Serpula lacrymans var. lacrymans S7.9]EGO29003.1 hypothetical protein SERLADRAFT_405170 [Serpula lacrymans var. lacrymans S7.9]